MAIPRLDFFDFLFGGGRGIRKDQVRWSDPTDDADFQAEVRRVQTQGTGGGGGVTGDVHTFIGNPTTYDEANNRIATTVAAPDIVRGDAVIFQVPDPLSAKTDALTFRVTDADGTTYSYALVNFDLSAVNAAELVAGAVYFAHRLHLANLDRWVLLEPTDLTRDQAEDETDDHFGLVSGERLFQAIRHHEEQLITSSPGNPTSSLGVVGGIHFNTASPGSIWYKSATATWNKLLDVSNPGTVLAQIAAQVQGFARAGNNDRLQAGKLGDSIGANEFLQTDGNDGHWVPLPNWVWQSDPMIPADKLGTNSANDRLLVAGRGWYTHAQVINILKGAIKTMLATDSDEISVDGTGHLTVSNAGRTTEQLQDLVAAMLTGNSSITYDDAAGTLALTLPTPSASGNTWVLKFFRPGSEPGKIIAERVGHINQNGRFTEWTGVPNYVGAGTNDWTIAVANAADFNGHFAGDLRFGAAVTPFSGDYDDLTDKPIVKGAHITPPTDAQLSALLLDDNDHRLYSPFFKASTALAWTRRTYDSTDLGSGQTFQGSVATYSDLPQTITLNHVYFVRSPGADFGLWVGNATAEWVRYDENIFGGHPYDNEETAREAVRTTYLTDDSFNGGHIAFRSNNVVTLFTITDYTAGSEEERYWVRMDHDVLDLVHALQTQVAARVRSTVHTTQAAYDAASATDGTLHILAIPSP